ncbi:MAG: hypothetical protein NTX50_30740 [Candidatus Sumerlaeota bacterium]|nr:hypothetical protein [Candidatus Sumerlaeota bacterium]
MPTYEYKCKCGEEFEIFQNITSEPVVKCPACGKKTKRLMSAGAGLIFKGSGFYITDYKNKGAAYAKQSKEESAAAAGKESAAEKSGTTAKSESATKSEGAGKTESSSTTTESKTSTSESKSAASSSSGGEKSSKDKSSTAKKE